VPRLHASAVRVYLSVGRWTQLVVKSIRADSVKGKERCGKRTRHEWLNTGKGDWMGGRVPWGVSGREAGEEFRELRCAGAWGASGRRP
jgi:hypothetical protein